MEEPVVYDDRKLNRNGKNVEELKKTCFNYLAFQEMTNQRVINTKKVFQDHKYLNGSKYLESQKLEIMCIKKNRHCSAIHSDTIQNFFRWWYNNTLFFLYKLYFLEYSMIREKIYKYCVYTNTTLFRYYYTLRFTHICGLCIR